MSRRTLLAGMAASVMAVSASACSLGLAGVIPYGVAISGEGNALTITQANRAEAFLATVHSARGIGQANVTWWGNPSPHQLMFALELAGLEQFTLQWADQVVNLGVNASDQSVFASARVAAGDEVVITPDSPYWMEVSTTAAAPGFMVHAPQAFLDAWPPMWSVTWVDFFR